MNNLLARLSAKPVTFFLTIISASRSVYAAEPMIMSGMYGPYSMTREASGTAWQPESTPYEGLDWMKGNWMMMLHGYANAGYTKQGGDRGTDQGFTTNM